MIACANTFVLGNISSILNESMPKTTLLLIALLVCHYLADFCLTMPVIIRAKTDGKSLWPIVFHATIHAVLIGLCLVVYGIRWQLLLALMMAELISHFVLDVSKTQISIRFPYWSDHRRKPYWMLHGLDQLLHQLVLIMIWYLAIL